MELNIDIKNIIEEYSSCFSNKELIKASNDISSKYLNNTSNGNRMVTSKLQACAYGITRFPATYKALSTILEWIDPTLINESKTLLDFGAGSGASTLAVLDSISSIEKAVLIEREAEMINLGKHIFNAASYSQSIQYFNTNELINSLKYKSDIVVASYVFNEIDNNEKTKLLSTLYSLTENILIIVEPGTKNGFENIKNIRNELIDNKGYIVCPCCHNESCKLDNEDWCHFTCRLSRSKKHMLLKDAVVPFEDEKFSYIVVSKNEYNTNGNRIIRHPIIEPKKILLKVCNKNGIEQIVVTKNNPKFKVARKLNSGDLLNN
ncbi:MAG: small ribosomal subunit Rsm22 family protein [Clostridia bacterium]|nr:small ribosomal subunit Rsm22 family protein [Clostridia bacterium]